MPQRTVSMRRTESTIRKDVQKNSESGHDHVRRSRVREEDADDSGKEEAEEGGVEVPSHRREVVLGCRRETSSVTNLGGQKKKDVHWKVKTVNPTKTNAVAAAAWSTIFES